MTYIFVFNLATAVSALAGLAGLLLAAGVPFTGFPWRLRLTASSRAKPSPAPAHGQLNHLLRLIKDKD